MRYKRLGRKMQKKKTASVSILNQYRFQEKKQMQSGGGQIDLIIQVCQKQKKLPGSMAS